MRPPSRPYDLARWLAAAVITLYGFAKLTGAQFLVLDSELDKPMREVSGFWLTWYYFSYSPAYKAVIALSEIGAGLLLSFRRTALLGACLLAALMTNILLIDVLYRVEAIPAVLALLGCAGVVIAHHRRELAAVFLAPPVPRPAERAGADGAARRLRWAGWAARVAIVAGAAWFGWYVRNTVVRRPTPLDGVWRVVEVAPRPSVEPPLRVYFERNRAHLAVFRNPFGTTRHHFELGPAGSDSAGTLEIRRGWLSKGDTVFAGRWRLTGDTLALEGWWGPQATTMRLVAERRAGR